MQLSDKQKKYLKGLAHPLKPIVMVGQQGLKPSILEELDIALEYHQLLKIKISAGDREERKRLLNTLLEHAKQAVLIQQIGTIAVLYQPNPEKPDLFSPKKS